MALCCLKLPLGWLDVVLVPLGWPEAFPHLLYPVFMCAVELLAIMLLASLFG